MHSDENSMTGLQYMPFYSIDRFQFDVIQFIGSFGHVAQLPVKSYTIGFNSVFRIKTSVRSIVI